MSARPTIEPPTSDEPEREVEPKARLSSRERRLESDAFAALAKTLVEMEPWRRNELPLPEDLKQAVTVAAGLRKGARMRELRRVSQLLRRVDMEAMTAAVRDVTGKQRGRAEREQGYERIRERLVAGGDAVLSAFVEEHPMADFKQLRALLRQIRREPAGGTSKQAMRAVLRAIRDACEVEVQVAHASVANRDDPA